MTLQTLLQNILRLDDAYITDKILKYILEDDIDEFRGKTVNIIYTEVLPLPVKLTTALLRDDLEFNKVIDLYSIQIQNNAILLRCSETSFKN